MPKLSWILSAALAAVMLSSAPQVALAGKKAQQSQVKPSEMAVINAIMQQGMKKGKDGDWDGAKESFRAIVSNPVFPKLSGEVRHYAYVSLALSESYSGEPQPAYEHILAAGQASPESIDGDYLLIVADLAFKADKDEAGGDAAIRAVSEFPQILKEDNDYQIFGLAGDLEKIKDDRVRYQKYLEALKASNYVPVDPFWSTESLWFDLFNIYADRGEDAKAQDIASSLTQPFTVMRRQTDRRYARFAPAGDDAYAKALDAAIAADRALAAKHPAKINGPQSLADRLMTANRLPEALKIIDDALAKAEAAPKDKPAFEDLNEYHNWALDTRSRILMLMGRGEDALQTQKKARDIALATGEDTVSQKINLGGVLNDLGKPQEALDEVRDVNLKGSSPYGVMSAEEVRACAYAQFGDKANLAKSLDYMKTHAEDGEAPLASALLCANDQEELAKRLIKRLDDPVDRGAALGEVQTYLPKPSPTAWQRTVDGRLAAVIARPDVRAAIEKYGFVHAYPVFRGSH